MLFLHIRRYRKFPIKNRELISILTLKSDIKLLNISNNCYFVLHVYIFLIMCLLHFLAKVNITKTFDMINHSYLDCRDFQSYKINVR